MQQYQVQLAQINVDQVQIDNQNVKASITDSQIVATMNGQVLALDIFAGTSATAYKPVITIGDVSAMEVTAEPDSTLVSQLAVGMPVTMVASFQPGVSLQGKIRQLPYTGTGAASADTSVHIQLATDPTKSSFSNGDALKVTVVLQDKKDVLYLPVQALRTFQNRLFVVVQDGSVQKSVDVKVGITGTDTVEILSGLTEGQTVVSP
jgi:HlyD family secretion protein